MLPNSFVRGPCTPKISTVLCIGVHRTATTATHLCGVSRNDIVLIITKIKVLCVPNGVINYSLPSRPRLKLAPLPLLGNYEDRGTVFIADNKCTLHWRRTLALATIALKIRIQTSATPTAIATSQLPNRMDSIMLQISERYLCTATFST